ncbi:MAG: sensor histidine kinase [Kiloniellaceae bacterium]
MTQATAKRRSRAKTQSLTFEVSAGLKRVIGRDLITDDEVAIFELVKNSFDAEATRVQLYFDDDRILIVDNGEGMSDDDIINKWLLVAYSSKRHADYDFRDRISSHRHFAGSKGIGRFSSDRLGHSLRLMSRSKGRAKTVHQVAIDWDKFEEDERKEFVQIPVEYSTRSDFDLPSGVKEPRSGTVLEVSGLRVIWDREKLLALKASLAKIINPFGAKSDDFRMEVIAPREKDEDRRIRREHADRVRSGEIEDNASFLQVVNGPIENFIFETLKDKTTFIEVGLAADGDTIETSLHDRGEEVYRIQEPNTYQHLKGSGFQCTIFYLNHSAKLTFAHRMGVPSVQFGSVFLFRNGIRVYPFGEQHDDTLAIDRRKQQGQRRFLGTRDIIGRINVSGDEKHFIEATSRNQGLVRTAAYLDLVDCFWEKCLRRLERYVVGVSWPDPGEKNASDLSRLLSAPGRSRVTEVVAQLARSKRVELLHYSPNLVQLLDEKADEFEGSLKSIRAVAEKAEDAILLDRIAKAEKRFHELQKAEEEARAQAEGERKARVEAEARVKGIASELKVVEEALSEERKRSLFLASLSNQDLETVQNIHHQIVIYASGIDQVLSRHLQSFQRGDAMDGEDVSAMLSDLVFRNRKVLSAARFATKANFRLESDFIEEDLSEFFVQYIEDVAPIFTSGSIRISASSDGIPFIRRFRPIEVSMIIDNLVNNSQKARASKIEFRLSFQKKDKALHIEVEDNGRGLSSKIEEADRIFEKGVTTTRGSGLGLYHIRQILGAMGGSITVEPKDRGIQFEITVV